MAGRIRERLARLLAERFTADGFKVQVDPERLWPAEGFWRTDSRADCYRWEGLIKVYDERGPTTTIYDGSGKVEESGKWQVITLGSYSTMTDCLKGFTYSHDGAAGIEIDALPADASARGKG